MSSELTYLLALDAPQKLELIGALWQSIEATGQTVEMSDALVDELDRRKAAAKRDPSSLIPWETIKQRLGLQNV